MSDRYDQPFHNIEAEEAVLGSLLLSLSDTMPEALARVMSALNPIHFHRDKNRWVYEGCQALFKQDIPIDQVTLAHELAKQKKLDAIGGAAYLSYLIQQIPTSLHVEYYARIVMDTYIERVRGNR